MDTIPNDAIDVPFTDDIELPNNFVLDDDSNGALPNVYRFDNVVAGSYSIEQTPAVPSCYDVAFTCSEDGVGTTSSTAGSVASIGLDDNENVTCAFTMTAQGTLQIVLDTVPDDAVNVLFTHNVGSSTQFSLDDDTDASLSNTQTFSDIFVGSYRVSSSLPRHYRVNIVCNDPDGGTTVDLDTRRINADIDCGENVVCKLSLIHI